MISQLAPMIGVTDVAFRELLSILTPNEIDETFTEFVHIEAFYHNPEFTINRYLRLFEGEENCIAQIWGNNTSKYNKIIDYVNENNFKGLNLNMGCPDKAVLKQQACSGLIENRDKADEIISISKDLSNHPVSVKTRIGLNEIDLSWIEFLLKFDLDQLIVHLRTTKELSNVDPHFELIDEINKLRKLIAPNTKFVINGEILNKDMGEEISEMNNIDGYMIGRGVLANPWCFSSKDKEYSYTDKISALELHVSLFEKYFGYLDRNTSELRRYFKIYLSGIEHVKKYRMNLMNTDDYGSIYNVIDELKVVYKA